MITAIVLAVGCSVTMVENRTNAWLRRDYSTLLASTERCRAKYPESPCVKLFRKHSFQGYHVLCGEPEKPRS